MNQLFEIPTACPVCFGFLSVEGDFLYCRNRSCPSQLSSAVKAWINKLGLLHWGDAMVEALTDPNDPKITSVADLYKLSVEQLSECCSGMKMAQKCYDTLHAEESITMELLLASVNIPNLGVSTATDIVNAGYDTVDKVLALGFDELVMIPNIASKTARGILQGLEDKGHILKELSKVLSVKASCGILSGKIFCITGELSKPRKTVEKMIMDAGGVVKGTVSSKTTFLVTNDPGTTSSKMKKAKKYGVEVINEVGLYGMIS